MPEIETTLKKGDFEGDTLIIANPGTGKTTALADRVVDLLKAGVPEKEILCITFTAKAAKEMRERIDAKIKQAGLENARPAEIAVHTFHSYALDYLTSVERDYRIMGNNAIRYSIYKSFQRNKALNYGNDYIIGEIVPKSENAIRYLKSFGILPSAVDIKRAREELQEVYAAEEISNITLEENLKFLDYFLDAFRDYESAKPKGFLDYNDLLIGFVSKHDRAKRHYGHVLVDELQDANELEAKIAVRSGDSLFLVGDRKQAIFGFQGGSMSNFKSFGLRSAHKRTLTLNYRSPQRVLDYARTHFLNNTADETYKQELDGLKSSDSAKSGEVQVIVSDMQGNAAIRKALELIEGGKGSVAIITRTNGQLLEVSKILDAKSVEYSSTISNATSDSAKEEIISFLRGILYDDQDMIVGALFTPFSGVPLKDAFSLSEKYGAEELTDADIKRIAAPFYERRQRASSLVDVQRMFSEIILPISMSISKDYFITASALQKNIAEFFSTIANPTRDDLFNYLAVTEESYEPIGMQKRLVLTTVHKAKGLEFDDVVYAPKEPRDRFSFIDAVVYAIIKSALGRDIREELEEEKFRVDFVAFTRTRNNLYIVAAPKSQSKYAIDGLSSSVAAAADGEPEPLGRNYDRAYAMFVAARYDKAREELNRRDDWLDELIRTTLGSIKRLSFSQVMSSGSPYDFLKYRILGVPQRVQAINTGLMVHQMAEDRFNGKLSVGSVTGEGKGYLSNIVAIDSEIRGHYKAKQIAAEEQIIVRASDAFDISGADGMEFKGTLDAVYECEGGDYLIADWKTDKAKDYDAEHRKQLAVYRRLYSKVHGVDESRISTVIAYVGLRGKINTGKLDFELEEAKPTATLIKNFQKQAQRFVDYLHNPSAFINAVLEDKNDEMLYEIVKRELARGLEDYTKI